MCYITVRRFFGAGGRRVVFAHTVGYGVARAARVVADAAHAHARRAFACAERK